MIASLKKYLSSPLGSSISLSLAVFIKVGLIRSFLEVSNDLLLTVVTTRNWLDGHGISIKASLPSDLSTSAYVPYTGWPPGVHLHLAPFLLVFGQNYLAAVFTLLAIVSIFFFYILKQLLVFIGFPIWLANLFLIFQALTLGKLLLVDSISDYTGLVYLLGALFFICKGLHSEKGMKWEILAALCLVSAGLIRYQYIPVVVMLCLAVLLLGLLNKKNRWVKSGLILFGSCSLILLGLTAFFILGSSEFYLTPLQRGFYPDNIQFAYPFMLRPLIDVEFYTVQLSRILHLPYGHVVEIFSRFGLFLLVIFTGYILYSFIRFKWKAFSSRESFTILGGFGSISIIALIFFLSIVVGTQLEPLFGNWTFVMEARYFAFPVLFLQIFIWRELFVMTVERKRNLRWFLKGLGILFALIWLTHGCYVFLKRTFRLTPLEDLSYKKEEISFVRKTVLQHRLSGSKKHIVFTGVNRLVCYAANWFGESAVYDPLSLNSYSPKASKETVLIIGLKKEHRKFLKQFLFRKDIQLIYSSERFEFYSLQVAETNRQQNSNSIQ
jgi:hypothetical protein